MGRFAFGVDVGGTTVKLGLFDGEGMLLEKWEIPTVTENKGTRILPDIAESIRKKMQERNITEQDLKGIGIGTPGAVDKKGYMPGGAVNIGWEPLNIPETLQAYIKVPVKAANDANVAAYGEMWKGGGAGCKNLVMVTLGTGVGGGVIVGGKIVVGQFGAGGEIGHMCVNYHETKQCGCGSYGCLEQYASATGIVRLATEKLESETRSTLLKKEELSAKAVFDAVKKGDEVATEIATEMGEYLGHALANIAAVLDPAIFVIGGGVSKAGDVLLPFIEKPFKDRAFFASQNVKFALATLGNDAGICGAAKMVLGD